MNYYYITGTSRGIGKAIAQELLKDGNNKVIGISRTKSLDHTNYEHIDLDLNNLEDVKKFRFYNYQDAEKFVLINNSGVLGHVKHIGNIDNQRIIDAYNINLIAPAILSNSFISAYKENKAVKIVLNISSGAARYVVKSWGSYCSSKAGLEMFARVLDDEQKELNQKNVYVYSIAPGIVDTEMQDEIRDVAPEDFSDLQRFIMLKNEDRLIKADVVATKLVQILQSPEKYPDILMDLRDQ